MCTTCTKKYLFFELLMVKHGQTWSKNEDFDLEKFSKIFFEKKNAQNKKLGWNLSKKKFAKTHLFENFIMF